MAGTNRGYTGAHATFYDALTATGDREDPAYYLDRAREAGGPVLELACGTGRIYLDLLEAGIDVDGFDRSADALAVLRERAAERGVEPSIWQADMAGFAVDRAYDLAVCPFNALQHLHSIEDQFSALQSVHDALTHGGRFVFDVFVPGFDVICESYGEWETRTVEYHGDDHEVRNRARIVDEIEQQFAVEVRAAGPDGKEVFAVEHRLKMLPKREVELLARLSPFEDWRVTGDFSDGPIEDGDSVQVWELKKHRG